MKNQDVMNHLLTTILQRYFIRTKLLEQNLAIKSGSSQIQIVLRYL